MRFEIECRGGVDGGTLERHRALSHDVFEFNGGGQLAIVGGGPSIEDHVFDLRTYECRGDDVWSINGAWEWCNHKGVRAFFYSADAGENIALLCAGSRAVLADHCAPSAFVAAKTVRRLPGPHQGPTSATASLISAVKAGYRKITYFGCESSYSGETHAYEDKSSDNWLVVRVNGHEYKTTLTLLAQAEIMSKVMRQHPETFDEKSGGLLRAMIANPEWDAVYGARDLVDYVGESARAA